MIIRSDKTFLFKNGDDEEEIIQAGETKALPDWVGKTELFKLAQKDQSLLVIANKKDKKRAENDENLKETSTEDKK
ncbi:hypothetical protein U728_3748 (plasmid) [Clostridium botulinum 202F]|nr:hypothetical protein U728_3748 [Clostridium botulinum 202F]KAI3344446.1 hypothetical protein CIT17_16875 [Clostridium botulinum]KON13493.1 hypothetical protein ACP50_05330 [Clostridium botulinum]MBY6987865.1 hypothetical protein [Clostridium botulinum]NFH01467.1 hypothetical protein [Clostridium botulinum]